MNSQDSVSNSAKNNLIARLPLSNAATSLRNASISLEISNAKDYRDVLDVHELTLSKFISFKPWI